MAVKSERVARMMQNFMEYHEKGYSIAEIAEKFAISKYTIYDRLQEIADENGVSRDSLLMKVHKSHETSFRTTSPKEYVNPETLLENFDTMIESVNTILADIKQVIEVEESEEEERNIND